MKHPEIIVVDVQGQERLFSPKDLSTICNVARSSLGFCLVNAEKKNSLRFTGDIIRNVAKFRSQATHLVMNVLDTINKETLPLLPDLEYIGLASAGWWDINDPQHFEHDAIRARGITVTNAGSYAASPVANFILKNLQAPKETQGIAVIGTGTMGSMTLRQLSDNGYRTHAIRSTTTNAEKLKVLGSVDAVCIQVQKSAGVVLGSNEFDSLQASTQIINASGFETVDLHMLRSFLERNPDSRYVHEAWPCDQCYSFLRQGNINPEQIDLPSELRASNTPEANRLRKQNVLRNLFTYIRKERDPKLINRVI